MAGFNPPDVLHPEKDIIYPLERRVGGLQN
jgi:hypothetical protein